MDWFLHGRDLRHKSVNEMRVRINKGHRINDCLHFSDDDSDQDKENEERDWRKRRNTTIERNYKKHTDDSRPADSYEKLKYNKSNTTDTDKYEKRNKSDSRKKKPRYVDYDRPPADEDVELDFKSRRRERDKKRDEDKKDENKDDSRVVEEPPEKKKKTIEDIFTKAGGHSVEYSDEIRNFHCEHLQTR